MASGKNLFAWASIGENGKATGGKAGDQTGNEVKVGNYYDFGQMFVLRFKDVSHGREAAAIAKKLANNPSIGYNQNERGTLYSLAKDCKWDCDKLIAALKSKKVNCDCSSLAATVVNLAYHKKIVPCYTTATMSQASPSQYFKLIDIKTAKKEWHKGDLVFKPYKHVIINI